MQKMRVKLHIWYHKIYIFINKSYRMNKSYKVGDIRNGYPVIPHAERKKIVLLSDDLRAFSGISVMSKEFVFATCHRYNYVQISGLIKHPDEGKIIDMNQAIREETGISDATLSLYPTSGYGDPNVLKAVIEKESPDGILHFTDPRFWIWLYQMEHELRVSYNIPIFYYTIWDCPPIPHWNKPFYESCDLLMCISRQTHALVRGCLGEGNFRTADDLTTNQNKPLVTYVPHGINPEKYYPISGDSPEQKELEDYKTKLLGGKDKKFILLYNNRNIRRKMTSDVILAYKTFCDGLPKEEANKVVLILKTNARDDNGTDLISIKNMLCNEYDVIFIDRGISEKELNYLYNIADTTINLANNEGFGLGTAESLMAGTPIIVNVTGGLQDQCGFKKNSSNNYLDLTDYTPQHPSNHNKTFDSHGEWVKPVWPAVRNLMGSIPTPYIFDDRCKWEDAAKAINDMFDKTREERKRIGLLGREFVLDTNVSLNSNDMGRLMIESMDMWYNNPSKRNRFEIIDSDQPKITPETGIII